MKTEKNKTWKSGLLLSGACALLAALAFVIGNGCFRGIRLAEKQPVSVVEIAAADSILYLPDSKPDTKSIYYAATRQTVVLSWEEKDEKGKTLSSVMGTGIILSRDGYIMTNAHVVADAQTKEAPITAELFDGRTFTAELIGADTDTDVALVKIEATGLSAAQVGSASGITPSDRVYVMGHPDEKLKFSFTSGIVSALDRSVTFSDGTTLTMFQMDAAVNPGNSGGPVYNEQGYVIGMTTAKYVNLSTEGIGFAIPMESAVKTAADLKEFGFVRGRPLMGITVMNAVAGADREDAPGGARVYGVEEGLCGEKAGLMKDDIIIAMNDEKIACMQDLLTAKKAFRAFDTVTLTVWRSGEVLKLQLTFDEATPEHPTGTRTIVPEESEAPENSEKPDETEPEEPEVSAPETEVPEAELPAEEAPETEETESGAALLPPAESEPD